jgi:hypothetical protein
MIAAMAACGGCGATMSPAEHYCRACGATARRASIIELERLDLAPGAVRSGQAASATPPAPQRARSPRLVAAVAATAFARLSRRRRSLSSRSPSPRS